MDLLLVWVVSVMLAISTSNAERRKIEPAPVPPPPTVEQMKELGYVQPIADVTEVTKTAKVQVDIKSTVDGQEINIKIKE